jgi:surface protein
MSYKINYTVKKGGRKKWKVDADVINSFSLIKSEKEYDNFVKSYREYGINNQISLKFNNFTIRYAAYWFIPEVPNKKEEDPKELYGELNNWDVSDVTNMYRVFARAFFFNENISEWNVSNVTDMSEMFFYTFEFNQDISKWNVSKVSNMSGMFNNARSFNQNINTKILPNGEIAWDVSNVTNMKEMFEGAYDFNQDINKWNVSNVGNMIRMFKETKGENIKVFLWDVSKVSSMYEMFQKSKFLDQRIGLWNINDNCKMGNMFEGTEINKYYMNYNLWMERKKYHKLFIPYGKKFSSYFTIPIPVSDEYIINIDNLRKELIIINDLYNLIQKLNDNFKNDFYEIDKDQILINELNDLFLKARLSEENEKKEKSQKKGILSFLPNKEKKLSESANKENDNVFNNIFKSFKTSKDNYITILKFKLNEMKIKKMIMKSNFLPELNSVYEENNLKDEISLIDFYPLNYNLKDDLLEKIKQLRNKRNVLKSETSEISKLIKDIKPMLEYILDFLVLKRI